MKKTPPWRIAESLKKLREQINAEYPTRSKVSDGAIGDAAHASRSSDHNPWVKDGAMGVVTAIDVTHDTKSGCTGDRLAKALIESRDERIKYIIWNRRMISSYKTSGTPAWTWRPYSGANAHAHHLHISVQDDKSLYDSRRDWDLEFDIAVVQPEQLEESANEIIQTTTADLAEASLPSNPTAQSEQPTETNVIVKDGDVTVKTTEGAKPDEKIAIEKPLAQNFATTMRNKIGAMTGGNLTLQAVRDYSEQARLFGLSARFWMWVSIIALVGAGVYLLSAFYKHKSDVRRDMEITDKLIAANSTDSNRVELVDKERIDEFKQKGYKIIER